MELLGDEHASWCEIAGVPTLFVDLSQTAAEQLQQVEETLATYLAGQTEPDAGSRPSGLCTSGGRGASGGPESAETSCLKRAYAFHV